MMSKSSTFPKRGQACISEWTWDSGSSLTLVNVFVLRNLIVFGLVSDSSPTLAFGSVAPLKDEGEYERDRGRERVLLS